MKKVFTPCIVLISLFANAQKFEKVENTPFEQFHFPAAAVFDADNDGFVDIIYTGSIDTDGDHQQDESQALYYKNNNGVFQDGVPLTIPVSGAKIVAFDRNNDGFKDIITVGRTFKTMLTDYQQLYENVKGEDFVLRSSNLPGKKTGSCSIDFADLDHDGILDYALNGELGWRTGFDFYPSTLGLTGMEATSYGDFKFADLNNDAEMDIITIGQEAKSPYDTYVKVYIKNGATYQLTHTYKGIDRGSIAVADFDADGHLDFAINGQYSDFTKVLNIYFNKGNAAEFEIKENPYGGLSVVNGGTSLIAGDLNNDGYYDLVSTGEFKDHTNSFTVGTTEVLYYEPHNRSFSRPSGSEPFIGIGSSSDVQLLDYNNDGKLDILLSGLDNKIQNAPASTALYRNTTDTSNQKPTPPTRLELKEQENKFIFSWEGATDDKTPEPGLSYEISIGTENGKANIAKYIVTTKHWFLDKSKLPSDANTLDKIHWNVKSIDAGNAFSDASKNQLSTYEIHTKDDTSISIYPNPATDYLHINSDEFIYAHIISSEGKLISTKIENKKINVSSLPKGIYILQLKTKEKSISKKFIKQ